MKKKYYRWLARRRLINRYLYLNTVNEIMEEYITEKLLAGGSDESLKVGREQLLKMQNETQENKRFVNFLKKLS